jgi:hypothetical protein
MTETTKTKSVGTKTPELLLPDATSTAETIINEAVKFCADKMRLGDYAMVVEKLRRCEESAANYCQYSIAKQVGESLGALDSTVQAVYMVDYDATAEDICFGAERGGVEPIHVIIEVKRKTKALGALVDALDRALVQRYATLLKLENLEHILDAQLVDGEDIKRRVGYGAMLSSIYRKPLQVWER